MPDVEIPLLVRVPDGMNAARQREPVTCGVPLPRGMAREDAAWTLVSADGTVLPVQTVATDRWPDGSVRWLLIDSQVSIRAGESTVPLTLRLAPAEPDHAASPACRVEKDTRGLTVDTGRATFALRTH